ncbi:glycosyltransferase [Undibacterium sp. Ji22W]|uniref:glycosyltransferase n=1 Tax=Undibacterium sp. Ji22W TaxID=3413038 RepID=UPI003BEFF46D
MRLLIDLQACQSSGSKTRGIGRYSMALAKAMVRQGAEHDIHLLLNAAFPVAVQEIREIFAELLPIENIHLWHGLTPSSELEAQNSWRLRANEFIREQAIRELAPDIVHISSLFEGLSDDAVTSVASTDKQAAPVAITLYDLIPLINARPYLENEQVRAWYYRKVQALKRADLLLAISESSRQEGLDYLYLPESRVVNISSAVDERFYVAEWPASALQELKLRYGLTHRFVMYTGGIDLRKNIEGLIEAYANLSSDIRAQLQLAIVCSVHENDRIRLQKLAKTFGLEDDELVMTGFVPDDDLPKLYHACELFVFPSWHEGFGLPALEAMACGAPVIAANTSSLPEVVGCDEALFDPRDIAKMTAKMEEVLLDQKMRQRLVMHGVEQAKKFSWDASARRALIALTALVESRKSDTLNSVASVAQYRPKLAYFSPVPPAQSGIADYSAELLPELAAHYDIDIIADQTQIADHWIAANFPIRDLNWFEQHAKRFDRILYNFGNSMFHEYMLDAMEQFPGIVVLHDFYHSGLISHLDLTGKRRGIWDTALFQAHGYSAVNNKMRTDDLNQIIWEYPCNQLVLDRAHGIIVHSGYSKTLAQKWYGAHAADAWHLIQHLRVLPQKIDRQQARKNLGLQEEDFLICSFGILGPTKLNHILLQAWLDSVCASDAHCHLVFVGRNDGGEYGVELLETIQKSAAADRIKITGFADVDLFRTYLQAADMAVQLRGLSRGETSGTVLDCLAYGLPTIINKNGSMAELPDEPLIKLEEQPDAVQLRVHIERLRAQATERVEYGTKAREYIAAKHAPNQIAEEYRTAIEGFYRTSESVQLRQTITKLAQLDDPFTQQDLMRAATCMQRNRVSHHRPRLLINCGNFYPRVDDELDDEILQNCLRALLNVVPVHIQVVPMVFADGCTRLAARSFERILGIHSYIGAQFDLEPIDLTTQDKVLSMIRAGDDLGVSDDLLLHLSWLGIVHRAVRIVDPAGMDVDGSEFLKNIAEIWR